MSEHLTNIVVVALISRDGKLFIARRADTKATFPGQFELVGGHVDPGEQPEEALRREVREEIGVEVVIDRPIGAFTFESEGMFKVELCYVCHLADPSSEPVLNPTDHSEAKWISQDEIGKFEKDDEETEMVREAFKFLQGANI